MTQHIKFFHGLLKQILPDIKPYDHDHHQREWYDKNHNVRIYLKKTGGVFYRNADYSTIHCDFDYLLPFYPSTARNSLITRRKLRNDWSQSADSILKRMTDCYKYQQDLLETHSILLKRQEQLKHHKATFMQELNDAGVVDDWFYISNVDKRTLRVKPKEITVEQALKIQEILNVQPD